MAAITTRLENQILHFSKMRKWDKVEGLWPELLKEPIENPKFYSTLIAEMVQDGKTTEARSWLMPVIEVCQTLEQNTLVVQIARGALAALPQFDELRKPVTSALEALYAKTPRLREFLDVSGMAHDEDLNKALRRFLQFLKCAEGEVFQHAEWGEGVVTRLDITENRVHLKFTKGGEKSFSFGGVNEYLKKIPRSHLLAKRLLRPEKLLQEAQKDPVAFIKDCLKSLGGSASRSDLKDHLTVGVFDTRSWNAWWSKNRDLLRFDPYIALTGSATNPKLELRTEPKSLHEEILTELDHTDNPVRETSLLGGMLKMGETAHLKPEAGREILARLEGKFARRRADDAAGRLEYLFLMAAVRDVLGVSCPTLDAHSPEAFLLASPQAVETMCRLQVPEHQVQAAQFLKQARGERWTEAAEELFLAAPMRLGQWLIRDLIAQGAGAAPASAAPGAEGGEAPRRPIDVASHMAEQLLHRPYENPELFLWLARAVRDGKMPELHVEVPAEVMLSASLDVIEDCAKRMGIDETEESALRGQMSKFQNFLMENHFALATQVFETLDTEAARHRYQELMNNHALGERFKLALDQVLRGVRRDLDEGQSDEDPTRTQGEHLVTAAAFKKRQTEYFHIKNTDVPENSKAIGTAAAMGDLSENAEYDAAKERQKVLFRRLESLEDLLQRARVVEPDQITTNEIGFGTTFQIKNMDSGEIETYSLLGLWDAEPEKNILSYLTPFGRQFLKRKVGDILVVVRPGGGSTQYKVLGIKNALAA